MMNFFKLVNYDFYQLVKPDGDLSSNDKMAINFQMKQPFFYQTCQTIFLATPIIWLKENCISSTASNFNEFKKKVLTQIELVSESNKTA